MSDNLSRLAAEFLSRNDRKKKLRKTIEAVLEWYPPEWKHEVAAYKLSKFLVLPVEKSTVVFSDKQKKAILSLFLSRLDPGEVLGNYLEVERLGTSGEEAGGRFSDGRLKTRVVHGIVEYARVVYGKRAEVSLRELVDGYKEFLVDKISKSMEMYDRDDGVAEFASSLVESIDWDSVSDVLMRKFGRRKSSDGRRRDTGKDENRLSGRRPEEAPDRVPSGVAVVVGSPEYFSRPEYFSHPEEDDDSGDETENEENEENEDGGDVGDGSEPGSEFGDFSEKGSLQQ